MKTHDELANDFVQATYLGIYDLENNRMEFLSTQGIEHQFGMLSFFQAMVDAGLSSVISPFYSFMAIRVFKEYHIQTYKASGYDLQKNIRLFKACLLKPFDHIDSFQNHQCASQCTGCNSVCNN